MDLFSHSGLFQDKTFQKTSTLERSSRTQRAGRAAWNPVNVVFRSRSRFLTRSPLQGVVQHLGRDGPYYTAPFKTSAWLEQNNPRGEDPPFLMMYNWPLNTGAQQTLLEWCRSTRPSTYRVSRPSLFLLYGYGCLTADTSTGLQLLHTWSSRVPLLHLFGPFKALS